MHLCHNFLMAKYIEMNFGGLIIGYNSNLHGGIKVSEGIKDVPIATCHLA